jgi:transglutaminase-like putative cysteine protease
MKPLIAGLVRLFVQRDLPAALAATLPIVLALAFLIIGGVFLLNRADAQARDTIRKHHLEDIEQALYFARGQHGTYPPYDESTWCGQLATPGSKTVRTQIEEVLRAQNEKYANPDKPFPADPLHDQLIPEAPDYFYWKRSPAVFELYAILEADQNGERSTRQCENAAGHDYDYGLTSVWRENS